MSTIDDTQPSKPLFYTGWVLTVIPALMFLGGSVTAFIGSPQVAASMAKYGFAPGFVHIIAPIELFCVVFFLIPRTAVFGALLLTAYLGGAVVTHLRVGEPQWFIPIVFGIVIWAGLLMRRPLLRKVIIEN